MGWILVLWVRLGWAAVFLCFDRLKLVKPSLYSSSSSLICPAFWLQRIVKRFALKTRNLPFSVVSTTVVFSDVFPSCLTPGSQDMVCHRARYRPPGEVHHSQGPRLRLRGGTLGGTPGPTEALQNQLEGDLEIRWFLSNDRSWSI